MTERTIPVLMQALAQMQATKDEYKHILAELDEHMQPLRDELFVAMQGAGTERTAAFNGYYGLISNTPKVTVVEPKKAMEWLEERNQLGRYLKLDEGLLKAEYKDKVSEIPGVRVFQSPVLSVRAKKGDE